MHKAPLVEAKQIEHVANERAVLGEVSHPFLVGLVGAYQDAASLYLLQVGVACLCLSCWLGLYLLALCSLVFAPAMELGGFAS